MSVNTAHTSNGVLLHSGEFILLYSGNVSMQFKGDHRAIFNGCKCGRIYLTSHRLIFRNKKPNDDMQSFSAPFMLLSDLKLEQPVLGPNCIKGNVQAQPNGNCFHDVSFKLSFRSGGAIEFGRALYRAVNIARRYAEQQYINDPPPPYVPPSAWHEAPPPAYQPPNAHTEWLPSHSSFGEPAPNTVFVSDSPPPYVGVGETPPDNIQTSIGDISIEGQNQDEHLSGYGNAASKCGPPNIGQNDGK